MEHPRTLDLLQIIGEYSKYGYIYLNQSAGGFEDIQSICLKFQNVCLTIFKIFAGAYLRYLSELSTYLSDNIQHYCPKIFKIVVGEYSMYGYSANSICADALDKIFVVAANKYELTLKWFCFGSYLPRDHPLDFSICATMVRG